MLGLVIVEHGQDLPPQAGGAPALEAMVDALPGAEAVGQRRPGAAGAFDPEHPGDDPAMIDVGSPARGPQWREERAHPLPGRLGQFGAVARRQWWACWRWG